jgi:hypothetical protein
MLAILASRMARSETRLSQQSAPPAAASAAEQITAGLPSLAAASGTALAVTTFVHSALAGRVLALEDTFARANQQVETYCAGRHLGITRCFESNVDPDDAATGRLAEVFLQQAQFLRGTSAFLATQLVALHLVTPMVTAQMDGLIEDLAVCSEQLMLLLQDYSQPLLALGQIPYTTSGAREAVQGLGYEPRVRSLLRLLRRAEGWLETIDHETGAHARLPGFAPAAPPLESQLALP